jgi:hypothetical protein
MPGARSNPNTGSSRRDRGDRKRAMEFSFRGLVESQWRGIVALHKRRQQRKPLVDREDEQE